MPRGQYIRTPQPVVVRRKVEIVIGPSIAYIPLTQGLFACVDSDDVARVDARNWCAVKSTSGAFYAYSRNGRQRRGLPLHRFIMGDENPLTVDHRHPLRTLDCRKANLRFATPSQQGMNRGIFSNNTSGHKGIRWVESRRKWYTYIYLNRKRIFLGCFS